MRCKNHGGLPASISGHDDTRMCDVCEYGRDSFLSGESPTVTVPRDQYELYKEAAEKWAEDATVDVFGLDEDEDTPPTRWRCNGCMRIEWRGTPVVHTADCKAARILGLKREGAG